MKINLCSRMLSRLAVLPLIGGVAMSLVGCGDDGQKSETGAASVSEATVAEASVAPDAVPAAAEDVPPAPEPEPEAVEDVPPAPEPEPEAVEDATPAPEPEPEAVEDATPAPEPEPEAVEDVPPAPEPEPEVTDVADFAPVSLRGKQIICSYAGAEISSHSTDDESPELPPFAPIQDNGKGAFDTEVGDIPMTRTLKVFSARTEDAASTLVKYTRTGVNTAEVQIISLMIPNAEAALAVANVAAAIDSLTEEQIFEQIGQYALDSSDTLRLTFTGENTATAEGEFCAGTVENKMRGMKVQLVDGAADAVTPDAPSADAAPAAPEEAGAEEPAEPEPEASDVAPADLKGKTVVLDYTMSQYMYEEDGENVSGWQLYDAALKNKNHCAEAFRALNLKPKATRNLLPITTPAQGGKYMYTRKNGYMGVIEVNTGMDASRVINIEFSSPTSGEAAEVVEAGCFRGMIRNIQVTIK